MVKLCEMLSMATNIRMYESKFPLNENSSLHNITFQDIELISMTLHSKETLSTRWKLDFPFIVFYLFSCMKL